MKEKFYKAWWYLIEHPKIDSWSLSNCLHIDVVKVNPKTGEVDDNKELNTRVDVWLEFGFPEYDGNLKTFMPTHDTAFDCGASTFEEAIIKLAELVRSKEE